MPFALPRPRPVIAEDWIQRWYEAGSSATSHYPTRYHSAKAEARAARLQQLGEAGTYKVHNCGKILHVDYDEGTLICERDSHYR